MVKTAMILAAGFGTRMGELTAQIPKPLLPIKQHTILELVILKLKNTGIHNIVINTHYLSHKLQEYLAINQNFGLNIKLIHEEQILGTGGGIANAESYFRDQPILVLNSDVLSSINLNEFLNYCSDNSLSAAMVVKPSYNSTAYSLVRYNQKNELLGFLARNGEPTGRENHGIFTGIQYLTPESRQNLKKHFSSVIDDLYYHGLTKNFNIQAYIFNGEWIDFGTKDQYFQYLQKFQSGILSVDQFIG